MTPWLPSADPAWQLAGWTMLLFLAVGTAVAALGAAVRMACRRTAPNVRYAISLATLLALAATPIAVAAYLAAQGVPTIAVATPLQPAALPGGSAIPPTPSAIAMPSGGATPAPDPGLNDAATLPAPFQPPALPGGSAIPLAPSTVATPSAGPTPGRSPGLNDYLPPATTTPPSPLATLIVWLPALWLAGAPLTFALLAAGLVGSRHLRRAGTPLVEGPVAEACRRLQRALGVTRRVALAACDTIAQPVLIGILRPTVLLPAAAIAGWSPADLEMILLHELAHVRRWDNLVNLGQRLIESLLFFHPCVWLASRQVRRDREDCCDALVVRHTNEPEAYATLLINVASSTRASGRLHPRHAAALLAASTMAAHPLASRVRRILKIEDEPMKISRRMLALILLLAVGVSTAAYRAAFAVPAPIEADAPETTEELVTVVYSADQLDRIPSRDWARLMSMPDAEATKIRWDYRHGEGARITGPQKFHDKIELILVGRGDEWPLYTKHITGNRTLLDAVDRLVQSFTANDGAEERDDDAADSQTGGAVAEQGERDSDEVIIRRVYKFEDADQVNVRDWMRLIAGRDRVEVRWLEDASGLVIGAPESVHGQIAEFLEASRRRAATQQSASTLRAEVAPRQQELEAVISQLKELEVLKDVALQGGPGTNGLDQAVADEIDKDPQIGQYQEQLFALKMQIQQLESSTRNPQDETLVRLQDQYREMEQALHMYRSQAEKEVRDRLTRGPNEALRPALTTYKVRRRALEKEQKLVEQAIADLKAKLTGLAQNVPVAQLPEAASSLRTSLAKFKRELETVAAQLRALAVMQEAASQGRTLNFNEVRQALVDEVDRDPVLQDLNRQMRDLKQQIERLEASGGEPEAELVELKKRLLEVSQALARRKSIPTAREWIEPFYEEIRNTPHPELAQRKHDLIERQSELDKLIAALRAKLVAVPEAEPVAQLGQAASAEPDVKEVSSSDERLTKSYRFRHLKIADLVEWLRHRGLLRVGVDVHFIDDQSVAVVATEAVHEQLAEFHKTHDTAPSTRDSSSPYEEPSTADGAADDSQSPARQHDDRYEQAVKLLADGKPRDAIAILNKILAADSAFTEAFIAKGDALKALSYFPEAMQAYSRALNLEERSTAALTGRGECFMATTPPSYDLALNDFASAIDLDRDNPVALAALGHIYVHAAQDPQRAINFLSEALLIDPRNASVYRDRALAYAQQRHYEHALRDAKKAIELQGADEARDATLAEIHGLMRKENAQHDRYGADAGPLHASSTDASSEQSELPAATTPLKTIRVRVLPDVNEANARRIARDLSASGLYAVVEKEGDGLVLVIETDIPNAFPVWETRIVDGAMEKILRLVVGSGAAAPGAMPEVGSPYAPPSLPGIEAGESDAEPSRTPRVIQPGDRLLVQTTGDGDIPASGVREIEPEGTLPLGPVVGRVAVAGKTLAEAERVIDAHVAKFYKGMLVQLTFEARPSTREQPGDGAATFRYDGKTFDEWRDALRYELKDDRRVSAMVALAAFARAGRGRDAAEAILDVASEYDFSVVGDEAGPFDPGPGLQSITLELFTHPRTSTIPAPDWLPLLAERLAADPAKWRPLAMRLFERLQTDEPKLLKLLQDLSHSDDRELAKAAGIPLRRRYSSWAGMLDSDKNEDGRVEASEVGPDVWQRLERADANGDQALDEDEWIAAEKRAREEAMMREH
jgi:beta-lactamase regulating signal transducer with metallopeptidase domain/Flp pilus assembly protein TadD